MFWLLWESWFVAAVGQSMAFKRRTAARADADWIEAMRGKK